MDPNISFFLFYITAHQLFRELLPQSFIPLCIISSVSFSVVSWVLPWPAPFTWRSLSCWQLPLKWVLQGRPRVPSVLSQPAPSGRSAPLIANQQRWFTSPQLKLFLRISTWIIIKGQLPQLELTMFFESKTGSIQLEQSVILLTAFLFLF